MSNINILQIQFLLFQISIFFRHKFFFFVNINACERRERKIKKESRAGRARGAIEDNERGHNEGAIVHWSETKAGHQYRGEVISWS